MKIKRIKNPYLSKVILTCAIESGKSAYKSFEPSNGGTGIILKTPSKTFA